MISDLEPAMKYSFCDFANHKVSLALSKCLSKWINWIYPYRVSRILSFEMEGSTALSFYVTKTVLVGPKWFWSDQIDLDLTIMIWS